MLEKDSPYFSILCKSVLFNFFIQATYLEILTSQRFSSISRVGNSAAQAGKGVLSTWTKCPPKLDPEMLHFF